MGSINVIDVEGQTHQLEANPGDKLMEIIRDAGFPVEAICGGEGSCATCHVHVPKEWYSKLPVASDLELEFIEVAMSYEPGMSRLSCQIIFQDEYDGMNIVLADED